MRNLPPPLKLYFTALCVLSLVFLAGCTTVPPIEPEENIKPEQIIEHASEPELAPEPELEQKIVLKQSVEPTQKVKHKPKVELQQVVTVSTGITNVPIIVSYQGGVFYRVQLKNNLKTEINLVWDASTYVTTTGKPIRLLHIRSKNELPKRSPAHQMSTRIAPNSKFQADFTGVSWLNCAKVNCKPKPKNGVKNAKMILTFNIKGKRVKWQGEISFTSIKQP